MVTLLTWAYLGDDARPGPFGADATTSRIMELLKTTRLRRAAPLMSSSPIAMIVQHRSADTTPPTAVTEGERQALLQAVAGVGEPRDRRGRRYPLVSMLATAVGAVRAGACTLVAVADRVADLGPPGWAKPGFAGRLPVPT